MFGLFKKKEKADKSRRLPEISDINDTPLLEGDKVESMRYDLGTCSIVVEDGQYHYKSDKTGETVSWVRMVDAISGRQKVKKIAN